MFEARSSTELDTNVVRKRHVFISRLNTLYVIWGERSKKYNGKEHLFNMGELYVLCFLIDKFVLQWFLHC